MAVVIADAGPLIGLARIGQLALLPSLFGTVWITEPIAAEIGVANQPAELSPYPGSEALGLAVRAQVRNGAVLAHIGELLSHSVR